MSSKGKTNVEIKKKMRCHKIATPREARTEKEKKKRDTGA